jgi:SAM-dependent methyltransferase
VRSALDVNRRNWDARAPLHAADATGKYRINAFRAGSDTLFKIEAGEIGDVRGLSVLRLQCHIGTDTLSLARRGAHVTGLDFSPQALRIARGFAQELSLDATFIEGSVYDTARLAPGPFDMVYTTWGIICWLPDLGRWAEEIATVLKPGGRFYFADGHPLAAMLEEVEGELRITYPFRTAPDAPLRFDTPHSYTGDAVPAGAQEAYEWIHPLSDIIGALTDAGLQPRFLHEHAISFWRNFPCLITQDDGSYTLPKGHPPIPLTVSLMAEKLS